MKLKKVVIAFILFTLAIPMAVLASSDDNIIESDSEVNEDLIIRESTEVEEGATINGDVTVFASDFELNGTLNGNLVVFGGDLIINGTVAGDMVVFGGDIAIQPSAAISGDCGLFGGTVSGQDICFNPITSEFNLTTLTEFLTATNLSDSGAEMTVIPPAGSNVFASSLTIFLTALIVGAMGYFITSAIPNRMYEVRSAVSHNPYIAGGIGMLTAVAGSSFLLLTSWIWIPILVALSFVCGIGVFLGFAGVFYLGAMILMGWITVGALAAGRFVDQTDPVNPNDPIVAALGTGIVTFGLGLLAIPFPVITIMTVTVLFFIGLGGVVLTRLGKQQFPRLPRDIDQDKFNKVMGTLPD